MPRKQANTSSPAEGQKLKRPSKSTRTSRTGSNPTAVDHRSMVDVPGLLKALERHVLEEAALSATQEVALSAVLGVVNLVLRFITTEPIAVVGAPKSS